MNTMTVATMESEGLTAEQASQKLKEHGRNELPSTERLSVFQRLRRLFTEPMLFLLLLTAVIYLLLGDLSEGLMLIASAFFVVGISYYQEMKSENALAALRELSSPRALVVRDGQDLRIPAGEVVPDDLVILSEGDRVPADGLILDCTSLSVDESLLTGESFAVKKRAGDSVFSSTLVTGGKAVARITKTGIHTEVGKIGKSLQMVQPEELNLSREIREMVKLFALTGLVICVLIVAVYGFKHGDWLRAMLVGLATQMALMPEEFPVVLTVFLALGAWRLSRVNVLVRKPGSIERLGAVTILCVDKTGTLTKNSMTVAALDHGSGAVTINADSRDKLQEAFHTVAEYGVLASHRDPFDPMEKAIRSLVADSSWGLSHVHDDWQLVRDYPLSDRLLAMSCVWKNQGTDELIIASKGAPEAIISLCHSSKEESDKIKSAVSVMASGGLRVIAVARALSVPKLLPESQHDFDFEYLGLIGLEDPIRKEVPPAVELCRQAGVRVIMMTGDYPETALKIASLAGIGTENEIITGSELEKLTDEQLLLRLSKVHVFARMVPDQKLRIVKLLQKQGHVVGMTGDGVNDAPSLKWADVGIAMGARGTDVAREASDIVLLDDNFTSIVSGIERGRLIFSNIRKAMAYIVSIHVPIAGLSILPAIFGWPLVLYPVHIVFLELIIDPACSLMFESLDSEQDTMKQAPRSLLERLFSRADMLRAGLQGLFVLCAALVVRQVSSSDSADPDTVRTFIFLALVMGNLALIFANMKSGAFRKKASYMVLVIVVLVSVLITQVDSIRKLFHFGGISIPELAAILSLAIPLYLVLYLWNHAQSRFQNQFRRAGSACRTGQAGQ